MEVMPLTSRVRVCVRADDVEADADVEDGVEDVDVDADADPAQAADGRSATIGATVTVRSVVELAVEVAAAEAAAEEEAEASTSSGLASLATSLICGGGGTPGPYGRSGVGVHFKSVRVYRPRHRFSHALQRLLPSQCTHVMSTQPNPHRRASRAADTSASGQHAHPAARVLT